MIKPLNKRKRNEKFSSIKRIFKLHLKCKTAKKTKELYKFQNHNFLS